MKHLLKVILYQPLFNALIFLAWLIPGHSIGWAIIILTIIIRLLLYPSNQKALIAQKKMRELAPELEKLKEKYKDDKQAFARAQMDFYKENKVNPFGGCLPLLIQLPILWVLFLVFRDGLSNNNLHDIYSFLPRPETINTYFFGINLALPDKYYILPILAGLTQFIQSRQIMTPMPKKKDGDNVDNLQYMLNNQFIYLMPLVTVFIALKFPAGLALYWIVTTLFAIAQQKVINRKKLIPTNGAISVKKGVEIKVRPARHASRSDAGGRKNGQ